MLLLSLLMLVAQQCSADFMLAAGNWTHSTDLFSKYHFVPGYNEKGEWDILTGGNWTATNHSDANLIGDAQIYLCPCPDPPCAPDPEPATPGYTTNVFGCVDPTANVSHAVFTVYHASRTNVTCVTPRHAVSCDVPAFDVNSSLLRWWENDELPSRSFYSPNVTAVSCIVRDLGDRPLPADLANFSDAQALQQAADRVQLWVYWCCTCACKHRTHAPGQHEEHTMVCMGAQPLAASGKLVGVQRHDCCHGRVSMVRYGSL